MAKYYPMEGWPITPLRQGSLDGLCGVYAIINALRAIYGPGRPLTPKASRMLFAEGIDALARRSRNAAFVYEGITVRRQIKIARAMLRSEVLSGLPPVSVREPVKGLRCDEDLDLVWSDARARGDVLLACFGGKLAHHTVIVDVTDQRVSLMDSDGKKFLYRSSIRLPSEDDADEKMSLISLVPIGLIR